jgi:N-methylhydantoinase A
MSRDMRLRAAVDIGGTFTDLVCMNEETGELTSAKVPTTPKDIRMGVIDAIETSKLDLTCCRYFIHGTTVGLNAFIQRSGAKTGLITTKGFRDVLEIARMSRDVMYNLWYARPAPFVPRPLRLEVDERIDAQGNVVRPLAISDVKKAIDYFKKTKVEAIAVCLLHSYANPVHERTVGKMLEKKLSSVPYSLSSNVVREYREYERTNTTVLDAYIKPQMSAYVKQLDYDLRRRGFIGKLMITLSSGGAQDAILYTKTPIMAFNSGPAGGVIGASNLSRKLGIQNIITADAGGTSFDVSLVNNHEPSVAEQLIIESYPILTSAIDIRSIGAGGGSIAWIDDAGHLRVGPQSAGADPGPMCYGKGGREPTVTDAAICAGILDPNYFLAGAIKLEPKLAFEGIDGIASKLDLSIEETAAGILSLVTANMAGAIREITIAQGRDPREFSLLSYGGATSMLVAELASELGMKTVVIPRQPGNFSAWGMLFMDIVYDYSQTCVRNFGVESIDSYNRIFSELEDTGREALRREGIEREDEVRFTSSIDLRYEWQSHYIQIPIPHDALRDRDIEHVASLFHEVHERNFGHRRSAKIQSVHLRVRATGVLPKPRIQESESRLEEKISNASLKGKRNAYIRSQGFISASVYDRSALSYGNVLNGPVVIEEETSTTLVRKSDRLIVDRLGNLIIEIRNN